MGLLSALVLTTTALATGPAHATQGHERPGRVLVREGESIQAAIDLAGPGTRIVVDGHHVENVWIRRDDITLTGRDDHASLTLPARPAPNPCSGTAADPSFPSSEVGPDEPALICVTAASAGTPPPHAYLDDVRVLDLTLHNPRGDALRASFTSDLLVRNVTAVDPGCAGISVVVADGADIRRNTVTGSAACNGIDVRASRNGRVARNESNDNALAGITVQDSSTFRITRNRLTGNCIGITVSDFPDVGFGISESGLPSQHVVVARNTSDANNRQCFPLGPSTPLGGTGIAIAGGHDITVVGNTTDDNVIAAPSISAAGIFVLDFGPAVVDGLTVDRNLARGNSSPAGPSDLRFLTGGVIDSVSRNVCGVSSPDPTWCDAGGRDHG